MGFNNSTTIILTIIEFMNSVLILFLSNYIFEGITIISIIYLASRQKIKGALDTTAKLVGIAAGSTIVYNSWFRRSSPSEEDDNNKNKKDKQEDKKSGNKQTSGSNVTNGKQ